VGVSGGERYRMRRGWAIVGGVGGDIVGDEDEGDDRGCGDLGIRSLSSLRLQISFSWVSVVEKSGHDIQFLPKPHSQC